MVKVTMFFKSSRLSTHRFTVLVVFPKLVGGGSKLSSTRTIKSNMFLGRTKSCVSTTNFQYTPRRTQGSASWKLLPYPRREQKDSTTGKEIVGGVAAGKKEANREVMGADGFISAFDLLRHF